MQGTAWKLWMASTDVTEAFCDLADKPIVINESINLLEKFIVLLCDRTSNEYSVSKAREQLFCRKSEQSMDFPQQRQH